MRTPIQLRLFLTILIVLLFGMGLAAGFAWLSVEQLFLSTLRENLLAQAELTAAALQDQPLPAESNEPYLQTANIQPGIHPRLLGNLQIRTSAIMLKNRAFLRMTLTMMTCNLYMRMRLRFMAAHTHHSGCQQSKNKEMGERSSHTATLQQN